MIVFKDANIKVCKFCQFKIKNVEDVYPCNQVCVVPCSCCDNILISKSHVEKHISYHTTFPVPVVRLIYLVRYCGYQTQTLISNTGKKVSGRNPLKIKKICRVKILFKYQGEGTQGTHSPTAMLVSLPATLNQLFCCQSQHRTEVIST